MLARGNMGSRRGHPVVTRTGKNGYRACTPLTAKSYSILNSPRSCNPSGTGYLSHQLPNRRSTRSASFRCTDFALATTYPGRIVFAIPQIATTATSRPEALTSRSMSFGSLVRIVAFCRRAVVTTTASTTSTVLDMPSSRPASCASVSPRRTTKHPVKKRRSWACCGDRLTWTTTGAGTNGTTPSSKRTLCSAHARRSFLSAATRTAAS